MDKDFFGRIEKGTALVEGPTFISIKSSWGSSVILDANTRIHFIEGEPSTHFHRFRTEDYILYNGDMVVYRGIYHEGDLERTVANLRATKMSPGDRVVMLPNTVHIPINLSPTGSTFFEVSHGPYEESDIERIYDKSGRDPDLAKKWSELGYEEGSSIIDLIPLVKNNLSEK